jgi:glycosyltransferase involved in cell wall biosynthesis
VKISIVTLSFNQRAYLQEAMDSVLSQEYPDLEYIVVDPGSSDGSRELISSYGDRISQTIFEPDSGAADGLNKGFACATGDIYGFLNADDLLFPESLNRVAKFFETHPECDMAMGNGYVIDGTGRKIRHIKARDFTVRRYFYGGTSWMQQSTFFRREIYLRSSKFKLQNRTCWDGELFVSMAKLGATVGYVNTDLSGFRIHATSISGSGTNQDAYKKDCRRIFRQTMGHDWTTTDELLRFLFRTEGFLLQIGSKMRGLISRGPG